MTTHKQLKVIATERLGSALTNFSEAEVALFETEKKIMRLKGKREDAEWAGDLVKIQMITTQLMILRKMIKLLLRTFKDLKRERIDANGVPIGK